MCQREDTIGHKTQTTGTRRSDGGKASAGAAAVVGDKTNAGFVGEKPSAEGDRGILPGMCPATQP